MIESSLHGGRLEYSVTLGGKPLLQPARIGIVVDGVNLAEGAQIGQAESYKINQTYAWYGAHSTAADNCNGARVALTHGKSRTAYTLEMGAYNDGVAFRHVVPGEGSRVPDEATVCRIPAASVVVPQYYVNGYEGPYPPRNMRSTVESLLPNEYQLAPFTFRLADNSITLCWHMLRPTGRELERQRAGQARRRAMGGVDHVRHPVRREMGEVRRHGGVIPEAASGREGPGPLAADTREQRRLLLVERHGERPAQAGLQLSLRPEPG